MPKKKDYITTIDCYTKAISICHSKKVPTASLLVERGNIYEKKGDLLAALADYEMASKYPMSIAAMDSKAFLCNALAKNSIEEGDFSQGMKYYEKALLANEYTVMEWKSRYHSLRRLSIYELRDQVLGKSNLVYHEPFFCADRCWIKLNNDYYNLENRDDTAKKINDLDHNFELSYAEWHYGNGNYAIAHYYIDRISRKNEFEKINDEMKHNILLLKDSLETMLKMGCPFGSICHTDILFGETIHLNSSYPTTTPNIP